MKIKYLDVNETFNVQLDGLTPQEFKKYQKYALTANQTVTKNTGKKYELINIGKRHVDHLVLKRIVSIAGVCLLFPLISKRFCTHLDDIWDRTIVVYKAIPPRHDDTVSDLSDVIVPLSDASDIEDPEETNESIIDEPVIDNEAQIEVEEERIETVEEERIEIVEEERIETVEQIPEGQQSDFAVQPETIDENKEDLNGETSGNETGTEKNQLKVEEQSPEQEFSIYEEKDDSSLGKETTEAPQEQQIISSTSIEQDHTSEIKEGVGETHEVQIKEEIEGSENEPTESSVVETKVDPIRLPFLGEFKEIPSEKKPLEQQPKSDESSIQDSKKPVVEEIIEFKEVIVPTQPKFIDLTEDKDWDDLAYEINEFVQKKDTDDLSEDEGMKTSFYLESDMRGLIDSTREKEIEFKVQELKQKKTAQLFNAFCRSEKSNPNSSPKSTQEMLKEISDNFTPGFFPDVLLGDDLVSSDLQDLFQIDDMPYCFRKDRFKATPWTEQDGKYVEDNEINEFNAYLVSIFGIDIAKKVISQGNALSEKGLTKGYYEFCLNAAKRIQRRMNVMHYLKDGMFKQSGKLLDSDAVYFHNDKMIKVDQTGSIDEVKKAKADGVKQFCQLLNHTYGLHLAGIISKKYHLDTKEELTLGNIRNCLMGVAANVRAYELEMLYLAIHGSTAKESASRMLCKQYLKKADSKMYDEIFKVKSFADLNNAQIHFLQSAFTTFPVTPKFMSSKHSTIDSANALELFSNGVPLSKDVELLMDYYKLEALPLWSQLKKDVKFGELSDEHVRKIAVCELLAKKYAYLDWNKDMICPLPDKDNNPVYYKVYDGFREDGVIPTLLVPVVVPANDKAVNFKFMFRGTITAEQWRRNFGTDGVGKENYEKHRDKYFAMLESSANECEKDDIILDITGHSLGGCDPKRFTIDLLEKIAASEEGSVWRKFKVINLVTHNAPSPEFDHNVRLKASIQKILDKKIDIKINIDHIRFFDKGKRGDIVHDCGQASIGANIDGKTNNDTILRDCDFFNCNLLEMCIDGDFGMLGILDRHSTPIFLGDKNCDLIGHYSVKNKDHDVLMSEKLIGTWNNTYSKSAFDKFAFITQLAICQALDLYQYKYTQKEALTTKL